MVLKFNGRVVGTLEVNQYGLIGLFRGTPSVRVAVKEFDKDCYSINASLVVFSSKVNLVDLESWLASKGIQCIS